MCVVLVVQQSHMSCPSSVSFMLITEINIFDHFSFLASGEM